MENDFNNCDICEKFFATFSELKEHILNDHQVTLEYITNKSEKIPNESIKNNENIKQENIMLNKTQRKNEGQRNYKCNICGKSFTQSNHLKTHIKAVHEGQRNYKCDSCGKPFTQSGSLTLHIKTVHEGKISKSEETHQYNS